MKTAPTSQMIPRLLAEVPAGLPAAPAQGTWDTETLLFTQLPVVDAERLVAEAIDAMAEGGAPGHRLVLTEHPPTFLMGSDSGPASLTISEEEATERGLVLLRNASSAGVSYLGPGMLMAWLAVGVDHLNHRNASLDQALAEVLVGVLEEFGIRGALVLADEDSDTLTLSVGGCLIATIETGVEVRQTAQGERMFARGVIALHTNTDLDPLGLIASGAGLTLGGATALEVTTLAAEGMPIERQDEVREALLRHYERVMGSSLLIPQRQGMRTAKPPWLKARLPFGPGTEKVHGIIDGHGLHTVCESARCPNLGECWRAGTATFMINGNVCTRSCSFCAIFTGRPKEIDPDEPRRVAEAAVKMGLKYVVVTAVNRDERRDGGAPQFAATIRELRAAIPGVHVEVLIPDFRGNREALDMVFEAAPDVLNHNMETVPRLYRWVRPQAVYQRSLDVLRAAHAAGLTAKSGIMVGLGEREEEVNQTLLDLREHGCDIVTIGQYLRPSEKHHPVVRYVTPAEFDRYRAHGEALGFKTIESGPLVRSSYHAHLSYRRHSDGNS